MRVIAALRLVPVLASAALAACGGGGGGDAGGPSNGGGAPRGFALNDANAVVASALAIRLTEHAGIIAELPLLAAIELDRDERSLSCGGTLIEFGHVDADGNGTISARDSISAEQRGPCSGLAAGKITLRLTAVDLQNLRIEGAAEFELDSMAGDRMTGTLSLATRADFTFDYLSFLLTNVQVTSTRLGSTERLSGGRLDRRLTLTDEYSVDFAGQVDSALVGGQYSFSTPARFVGSLGMLPSVGELVAVAGATRVRVAVAAAPEQRQLTADYQVDAGSGYGPMSSVRWRELTTGLLFYWVPNDPPVISSLEVLPADAPTGSNVTAYAAATDADGDPLTFRFDWAVGTTTYANFGPVFNLGGLRKGERVTVTVTVSDGRAETTRSTSFTVANAAPVITSLTIDPPAPRSIDDLTVTAAYEDLDAADAAFIAEFEWRRNGSTIPGARGDTLPRSAYAKNDVVTVIVYVTDGATTVAREASVTIGDSLPQLTWLSPPQTVAHGAPFTARAVAEDPDGEALPPELRYELRYGPAGMTVDPTTGAVSWLAGGPMFERSMDVRYGVGTSIEGAGSIGGVVVLQDADREYPLARSSLDPGRWYAGLRAGDFDGDGDAEMLMLTDDGVLYELEAAGNTYRQSWLYPFSLSPVPLALATANVDSHPAHEIFVATGNTLLRLDGVERRITATATLPLPAFFSTCADLEAADLDGDTTLELVCSVSHDGHVDAPGAQPLLVIDPATLAVEAQIPGGELGNDIAIGNVDADPALEIVTSRGFVFDGVTLQQEWESPETFPGLAVGDVTGDGIAEIVTSYPTDFSGANGRVYSAVTRGALFDLPHRGYSTNLVANVDGVPGNEIVMAGSRFAAYRYPGAGSVATLFSMVLPGDTGATTLAVANVDQSQDPRLEFVMGINDDSIGIADWPAAGIRIEWSSAALEPAVPQTLTGPFYGGELARDPANAPRPLFMTQQTGFRGARLFTLDPASGDLTFAPEIPQGPTLYDRGDLAVVDFDRDGTDEAFVALADMQEPTAGVYDFFAGQLLFRSPPTMPGRGVIDVDHGDLNGDGRDDLVALTIDGLLLVYDVFAGVPLLSEQLLPGGQAVVVAELNGSGPPEIIAATWGQAVVYSRASATAPLLRMHESVAHPYTGDLIAGDVDGDGRSEIFFVYAGAEPAIQRFNERLEPGPRLLLDGWLPTSLSIERSAFGRKNLVATAAVSGGSQIRVIDPLLGEEIWRSPTMQGSFAPNSVHFVDIAGDGDLRIAFGTFSGVFLTR